jgi:hypothetical protein
MAAEPLPVPITEGPRRRIVIRPPEFQEERLSLGSLRGIIERTRVQLRGWDFPHASSREKEWGRGTNWIASWSSFGGHLEYWRMFQSGRFLHLEGIRETIEKEWDQRLRQAASFFSDNEGEVEGLFDFINFIYSMTEVFEFAANLCQAEVFTDGSVIVDVGFYSIANFGISTSQSRDVRRLYRTNANEIHKTWEIEKAELISASADISLRAIVWFFERFQWDEQPVQIFKEEQQKLLERRL